MGPLVILKKKKVDLSLPPHSCSSLLPPPPGRAPATASTSLTLANGGPRAPPPSILKAR